MRARQKVSRAGVELIKSFEGLRQTAARLPDGRWTIGYGHTFSAREGARVTQEDADALLRFDLLPIVDSLNNLVLVPLNQNQFDALVSFSFNIGIDNFASSTVLKRINEGRMTEAALAMDAWRSAEFNGQTYVLAPLIRRRAAEKNLFLTPEETAANAPSLLVRPLADVEADAAVMHPAEVDAPDRGGILSAYPAGEPQAAPQPSAQSPARSPYAASTYAGDTAAPAAPLSPYAGAPGPQPALQPAMDAAPRERQFIDLASVTPRPLPEVPAPVQAAPQPVAPVLKPSDISPYPPMVSPYTSPYAQPVPQAPVVEALPGGYTAPAEVRETPEPPAPSTFDPAFGAAVMSPEVAAALARAQDEQRQREEAERAAQQAAARAVEEARIRELQRQEAERLERQRQEQDRLERARLEAERQDQERLERVRLEQERAEQARLELERLERERLERERVENERAEQARLEQERLERDRLERERAEQVRLEAERLERARLEQERLEQERAERARLEQERMNAAAAAATPVVDDAAEKARKAEAAAALMRLYSPYGGGPLGRPLGGLNIAPAMPQTSPGDTASDPKPVAPQAAEPEPEAAKRPVEEFVSPAAAALDLAGEAEDDGVPVFSTRVEARDDSEDDAASFRPFTPIMSAANLPAPIVTALNPYASPLPRTAVREASENVVEVPRPQPIALDAAQAQPAPARADDGLHWRERLQRPLPADHQPDLAAPERPAGPQRKAASTGEYAGAHAQDDAHGHGEAWLHDGRIAMSNTDEEVQPVGWLNMFLSTIWWILLSIVGIVSLGVAAGAYYKSKDLSVIRNGLQPDLALVSIITAVIGFVLVSTSMWLMMRRLGGLKE
jgi:GH24 family phage-related lysozyme (muramidase)